MSESKTLQSLRRSVGISLLAVVLVGCPAAPEDEIRGARVREVTILYTNHRQQTVAETFVFGDGAKVMLSVATYA